MKRFQFFITLPLFLLLVACYATDSITDTPADDRPDEDQSAKITHEDGWTIVSKTENADRVYWFLAPEVNNVSPAMFKKIIYAGDNSGLETKTVSECDAPKQTCDELMAKFRRLSEKYK